MIEFFELINERKKSFDSYNVAKNSNEISIDIQVESEPELVKCPQCNKGIKYVDLSENKKVCNFCNYHFKMNSMERINLIFDSETVEIIDDNLRSCNPLGFPNYNEKLEHAKSELGIEDAVITGKGSVFGNEIYFGIMDYRFIMGSMGSVVGEKLTRMIERATETNKAIVIFSASGGARMQEGMISLYQMAKVTAAIEKHNSKGLMYISVLTNPTTGGVIASFASSADIIIAEPNATVGFAGARVIKNTINEEIPDNFQTTEFHFENGHIDIICNRNKLKKLIAELINFKNSNIGKKNGESEHKRRQLNNLVEQSKDPLNALDKVRIARDMKRPNFRQYIDNLLDGFIELHGDRISMDDSAIVAGIGYLYSIPLIALFSAKGNDLEENKLRNFGMAKPGGYRKVIRVSKLAEKLCIPVVCFIDTPGAFCDVESEKMGQAAAIADSIRSFSKLKVPVISVITGEGGSGGALAMGVSDWIFIMENSIYSVISPEGCATILFKDSSKISECCEYLKLTSNELLSLGIVDEIVPELKTASNSYSTEHFELLKCRVYERLQQLIHTDTKVLLDKRYEKFRKQGTYIEL